MFVPENWFKLRTKVFNKLLWFVLETIRPSFVARILEPANKFKVEEGTKDPEGYKILRFVIKWRRSSHRYQIRPESFHRFYLIL